MNCVNQIFYFLIQLTRYFFSISFFLSQDIFSADTQLLEDDNQERAGNDKMDIHQDIFSADTQLLEDDDNQERAGNDKMDIHQRDFRTTDGGVEQPDRHYKKHLTSLHDPDEEPK